MKIEWRNVIFLVLSLAVIITIAATVPFLPLIFGIAFVLVVWTIDIVNCLRGRH